MHFIQEWDGTVRKVDVVEFGPRQTTFEYEDGVRHKVPTEYFLDEIYVGPVKDAPGANLRYHFRGERGRY